MPLRMNPAARPSFNEDEHRAGSGPVRRLWRRLGLAALAFSGTGMIGACATAPSRETVVIDAGRLFDGQRTIDDGRVIIEGDRIVAAGPRSTLAAPAGARMVDHGDRFVMPGLIAAHSHVGTVSGTEHGGRFYSRDTVLRDLAQFQRYGVVAVNALGMNRPGFHEYRREMRQYSGREQHFNGRTRNLYPRLGRRANRRPGYRYRRGI